MGLGHLLDLCILRDDGDLKGVPPAFMIFGPRLLKLSLFFLVELAGTLMTMSARAPLT